jgi:hypothetical protein
MMKTSVLQTHHSLIHLRCGGGNLVGWTPKIWEGKKMRRSFSATILVPVNKLSCGRETQSGTSPFFPEFFGNLWIPGSILYAC